MCTHLHVHVHRAIFTDHMHCTVHSNNNTNNTQITYKNYAPHLFSPFIPEHHFPWLKPPSCELPQLLAYQNCSNPGADNCDL